MFGCFAKSVSVSAPFIKTANVTVKVKTADILFWVTNGGASESRSFVYKNDFNKNKRKLPKQYSKSSNNKTVRSGSVDAQESTPAR